MLYRLFKRQEGQSLAEYALILALIAVVALAALTVLGGDGGKTLLDFWNSIWKAGLDIWHGLFG